MVDKIVQIKSDPETDYGYQSMTAALMLLGFIINPKKVYRLMKEYQLLHEKKKKPRRTYVKYRRLDPNQPLEAIEMDIKYQWVNEHRRYAFILTIIDCFTRKVLHWSVAYSVKKRQVIKAWDEVIINYLQPYKMLEKPIKIEVRNDNDSRFAAKEVQNYMAENYLNQVFTHPYTPEENGHVESFHAILGRSLDRRYFNTIMDLERHLKHFYATYNDVRLHGSLDHLSPTLFWEVWAKGMIKSTKRKNKITKHQLNMPHYLLSGNGNLKGASDMPEGQPKQAQIKMH